MGNDNFKCLNSFTILSFNPNNIFVSFNAETLLLDKKQNNDEVPLITENEENTEPSNNQGEYWIIEKDGVNKIFIKTFENDSEFNSNIIKAGPFFSIVDVVSYLNILNDMEF